MKKDRIEPGPGQESVWDYPRPPGVEPVSQRVRIEHRGELIADSTSSYRVLETSHPPVYYLPPQDIRMEWVESSRHGSFCEWKGHARYHSLHVGSDRVDNAAWSYPNPTLRFEMIAGFLAFYPSKVDACFVGDDRVAAQEGDFYGGWITPNIVGPFKGGVGTMGW